MTTTHSTDLAPRLSVDQVVRIYEQAERDIRDGFALVARAERTLGETLGDADRIRWVRCRDRYDRVDFDDAEGALTAVRRQVWETLVERLELRRFMSVAAWTDLEKQLRDDKEVPEITQETVLGMAEGFRSKLPEMLQQAVVEVFDWLRPRGGTRLAGYKTNDEVEVGRKVIVGWGVEKWASTWHVIHHVEPKLTALENVFTALDGRGQVTRTHYSAISTAIKQIPAGAPCVGETPYFRFRGYQNRNLHLEFLREDLLARFNALAGGARLKPAREVP